ncbi:MAG: hypothetical protein ACJ72Z_02810 [Pyrinomonadaceae bacterium]
MSFKVFILLLIASAFTITVSGQKRDYMLPNEADMVRVNQDIDARIAVLSYMIDRRFTAMGIKSGGSKPPKSPEGDDDWSIEPSGSKLELLTDIRFLLEKAIDDIDNLAGHLPERAKEERKGVNLFNKAVRSLDASAKRWMPFLKKELEAAGDEKMYSVTTASIEFCEQIMDAAKKLK